MYTIETSLHDGTQPGRDVYCPIVILISSYLKYTEISTWGVEYINCTRSEFKDIYLSTGTKILLLHHKVYVCLLAML